MKKLEQIQVNKLISRYGGVGSIIETNTNGSLLVKPYDEWRCFSDMAHNIEEVDDKRLLQYVQANDYAYVERLVPIPTPDALSKKVYYPNDADINKTATADYFPTWYYCPNCRKLKPLIKWENEWKNRFDNDDSFYNNPPACYHCSDRIGARKFRRHLLQQVRFVMASLDTGELKDVPFDRLWDTQPNNGVWRCERPQNEVNLTYHTSQNGDGLNAIYIKNGESIINLSVLERNYIIFAGTAYKMIVKGSNSIYFPEIVRSLWIPTDNNNPQNNTAQDLNLDEFAYLINDKNYTNSLIVKNDLFVRRTNLKSKFISRISAIERLKETSVLLSYSRLENKGCEREWYDVLTKEISSKYAQSKKTFSDRCQNPTWMPAVEQFGEGILFEIDSDKWETIEEEHIHEFVHTFCHIIMKEMEFQCGYPLASLKEKIYIDKEKSKAGFLIYTIAGSEGSYGGLVSLTSDNKIIKLIDRGTERAKNCPNDPICIEESAHCFACLDLPETSCIEFNKNLNRKRFIEKYHNLSESNTTSQQENTPTQDQTAGERPKGLVL